MDAKARQRADSIMGSVCVNAPIEYRQWEQMRDHIERSIADAREEGRAAGYAEAKEQAAQLADGSGGVVKDGHWDVPIADAIRALAPATTKEPT